jgi:hypothetical protein
MHVDIEMSFQSGVSEKTYIVIQERVILGNSMEFFRCFLTQ